MPLRQQTIALRHAPKLLSPTLLDYPGYGGQIKRKLEVASELHYPHICEVQDYGEATITPLGRTPSTPGMEGGFLGGGRGPCSKLLQG